MWTREFWKATAERMVRSATGAMLSVLVVGDGLLDALNADWGNTLSIGAGGAVVALLLALSGNAVTGTGPSFSNVEVVDPNGPDPPAPPQH